MNVSLEGEKNSSAEVTAKLDTMRSLFTSCDMGYAGANVTIEFLVRLTNEFSGKLSSCQLALNASLNETKDLSGDLEACRNSSKASTSVLDRQHKNFTDHGRLLDQCRKDLEAARKDVENVTKAHNGETAYLF